MKGFTVTGWKIFYVPLIFIILVFIAGYYLGCNKKETMSELNASVMQNISLNTIDENVDLQHCLRICRTYAEKGDFECDYTVGKEYYKLMEALKVLGYKVYVQDVKDESRTLNISWYDPRR